MAIPDDGLPEPDFKVVRGKPEDYPRFHPSTREVAWIAEIAESSLAEDQGEVLQTYAEHEIPVYWIVNLPGRRIQVHTDPSGSSASPAYYRTLRTFVAGDEIPLILDGRDLGRIAVADILTV